MMAARHIPTCQKITKGVTFEHQDYNFKRLDISHDLKDNNKVKASNLKNEVLQDLKHELFHYFDYVLVDKYDRNSGKRTSSVVSCGDNINIELTNRSSEQKRNVWNISSDKRENRKVNESLNDAEDTPGVNLSYFGQQANDETRECANSCNFEREGNVSNKQVCRHIEESIAFKNESPKPIVFSEKDFGQNDTKISTCENKTKTFTKQQAGSTHENDTVVSGTKNDLSKTDAKRNDTNKSCCENESTTFANQQDDSMNYNDTKNGESCNLSRTDARLNDSKNSSCGNEHDGSGLPDDSTTESVTIDNLFTADVTKRLSFESKRKELVKQQNKPKEENHSSNSELTNDLFNSRLESEKKSLVNEKHKSTNKNQHVDNGSVNSKSITGSSVSGVKEIWIPSSIFRNKDKYPLQQHNESTRENETIHDLSGTDVRENEPDNTNYGSNILWNQQRRSDKQNVSTKNGSDYGQSAEVDGRRYTGTGMNPNIFLTADIDQIAVYFDSNSVSGGKDISTIYCRSLDERGPFDNDIKQSVVYIIGNDFKELYPLIYRSINANNLSVFRIEQIFGDLMNSNLDKVRKRLLKQTESIQQIKVTPDTGSSFIGQRIRLDMFNICAAEQTEISLTKDALKQNGTFVKCEGCAYKKNIAMCYDPNNKCWLLVDGNFEIYIDDRKRYELSSGNTLCEVTKHIQELDYSKGDDVQRFLYDLYQKKNFQFRQMLGFPFSLEDNITEDKSFFNWRKTVKYIFILLQNMLENNMNNIVELSESVEKGQGKGNIHEMHKKVPPQRLVVVRYNRYVYTVFGLDFIQNKKNRVKIATQLQKLYCGQIAARLNLSLSNNETFDGLLMRFKSVRNSHFVRMHNLRTSYENFEYSNHFKSDQRERGQAIFLEEIIDNKVRNFDCRMARERRQSNFSEHCREQMIHQNESISLESDVFTWYRINNRYILYLLSEIYRLCMTLYGMLIATAVKELESETMGKKCHKEFTQMNVVMAVYFEDAMRESERILAQLTFTNIYSLDDRIPTAVPIYRDGFINRKDRQR